MNFSRSCLMILRCLKYFTQILSGRYMKVLFSMQKRSIFGFHKVKVYMIYILNDTMNSKIISFVACDIYLRIGNYRLVKFMGVLINWNVQSIMVVLRLLLYIICFIYLCLSIRWWLFLQKKLLILKVGRNGRWTIRERSSFGKIYFCSPNAKVTCYFFWCYI